MYKTIYELTTEQLDELRDNLYWGRTDDCLWATPSDVTDAILFKTYKDTSFTDDDFFCTAGKEVN